MPFISVPVGNGRTILVTVIDDSGNARKPSFSRGTGFCPICGKKLGTKKLDNSGLITNEMKKVFARHAKTRKGH